MDLEQQQPESTRPAANHGLSARIGFRDVDWSAIPIATGVYAIFDKDECIYVGMSGRNGKGNLRSRLRAHASGQMVNMFAQYLFLARVQFLPPERITHPREAKAACRDYIAELCSFQYRVAKDAAEARQFESELKDKLKPALNP
jgi:hypothetical protein